MAQESIQAQLNFRISQMEKDHASKQQEMRADFSAKRLQLEHQKDVDIACLTDRSRDGRRNWRGIILK